MRGYKNTFFLTISIFCLICFKSTGYAGVGGLTVNVYKTISVLSCDSLIKANEKNPDFVILDVRTPDVWKADHLQGSINRNYYDTDFSAQLTALPKHKLFLLHCQSGSRSAATFSIMKNLGFAAVYEMAGGISSWKFSGLPTTSALAPRLMLVSRGGTKNGTVQYGVPDTLMITITNRANDTLRFTSLVLPGGSEFTASFDLKKKLSGSQDYSFPLYYKPLQQNKDSVRITIRSNGGDLTFSLILKNSPSQYLHDIGQKIPEIYPNPATDHISFKNCPVPVLESISFTNLNGQLIKEEKAVPVTERLDVSGLPGGVYIVQLTMLTRNYKYKLLIKK